MSSFGFPVCRSAFAADAHEASVRSNGDIGSEKAHLSASSTPPVPVSSLVLLLECRRRFYMEMKIPKARCRSGTRPERKNGSLERDRAGNCAEGHPPPACRMADLQLPALNLKGRVRLLEAAGCQTPMIVRRRIGEEDMRGIALEAAAYCLMVREWGRRCDKALVHETDSGEETEIELTERAVAEVRDSALMAAELLAAGSLPEGTPGTWCRGCRFRRSCHSGQEADSRTTHEQPCTSGSASEQTSVQRVAPLCSVEELADDPREVPDTLPLYVREQGSRLEAEEAGIVVRKSGEVMARARLTDISQICLMGNVQITSQCLRRAFRADIPVVFLTRSGMFCGTARGFSDRNAHYRRAQYEALKGPKPLEIARALVAAKIMNCRTMLLRNARGLPGDVAGVLKRLADGALAAESVESLRGYEGSATAVYFSRFDLMLRGGRNAGSLEFDGRNRRPPRDPVNAMLSFTYSLLARDMAVILESIGLDPMQGFYHSCRNRRPALALDLMEPLRPVLADSVVTGLVRNGQAKPEDFLATEVSVSMTDGMRKKLISA